MTPAFPEIQTLTGATCSQVREQRNNSAASFLYLSPNGKASGEDVLQIKVVSALD
jgi:hypothetical protein